MRLWEAEFNEEEAKGFTVVRGAGAERGCVFDAVGDGVGVGRGVGTLQGLTHLWRWKRDGECCISRW